MVATEQAARPRHRDTKMSKKHGKRAATSNAEREYERNCRKIFIHQMYADADPYALRHAYVQCASKRRFETIRQAEATGAMYGGQMAYLCPQCHGWHLTTNAMYGQERQNRDWHLADELRREIGITDDDLEGKVWMGIFAEEGRKDAVTMAAEFAGELDREMREHISCRRGKIAYGSASTMAA